MVGKDALEALKELKLMRSKELRQRPKKISPPLGKKLYLLNNVVTDAA